MDLTIAAHVLRGPLNHLVSTAFPEAIVEEAVAAGLVGRVVRPLSAEGICSGWGVV